MGKKHKKHKSERRNEDDDEKPHLKIVIKRGGDSDYAANSPASYAGEYTIDNEKHHKKKRKKKRHTSEDNQEPILHPLKIKKFRQEYDEPPISEDSQPQPTSSALDPPPMSSDNASISSQSTSFSPPPKFEEKQQPKKSIIVTEHMKKSLSKLLEHLLRQLERKDPHEIFAWPVNDLIAPGYSDMIDKPMDFSTIRKKIARNVYNDVTEFKADFNLMIDNCCKYNRPDTIFYEVGRKLLSAGLKIMSKERLLNMKRTLNFLHDLTKEECLHIMGLSLDTSDFDENMVLDVEDAGSNTMDDHSVDGIPKITTILEEASEKPDSDMRSHRDAISFTDADNEETVAPDVLKAAKEARERLAQRCPKSKMGFLRIDDVGKTTFNFLNPDIYEQESEIVDLGTLTGRLSSGLNTLPDAKEDKRNKIVPLSYLGYGPFSSFSPTYDSRIANITRDESDLLLSMYGGETEYLFSKSLHHFVKDSGDDLIHMVDELIDTLTHGAHKRAMNDINAKRQAEAEKNRKAAENIGGGESVGGQDEEVNHELEALLDSDSVANPLQEKLDRVGELVVKLEQTQTERLSEQPLPGQPNLKGPSDKENAIAAELKSELSELVQHTQPDQISSLIGVRKAMGIEIPPATGQVCDIE